MSGRVASGLRASSSPSCPSAHACVSEQTPRGRTQVRFCPPTNLPPLRGEEEERVHETNSPGVCPPQSTWGRDRGLALSNPFFLSLLRPVDVRAPAGADADSRVPRPGLWFWVLAGTPPGRARRRITPPPAAHARAPPPHPRLARTLGGVGDRAGAGLPRKPGLRSGVTPGPSTEVLGDCGVD